MPLGILPKQKRYMPENTNTNTTVPFSYHIWRRSFHVSLISEMIWWLPITQTSKYTCAKLLTIITDLTFVDDLHLEPCCQYAFYRMKQFLPGDKVMLIISNLRKLPNPSFAMQGLLFEIYRIPNWNEYDKADTMQEEDAEEVDNFGQGGFNRARKFIWELFEEPNKSKLGKVVTIFFLELDLMACQRLLARTQLMPNVELYSHQLHLKKTTARAHFVPGAHFVHFVHTTHAVLSCTGQWMCSNHQKQLLQLSQLHSCHSQQSCKLSEHRHHLDLLKLWRHSSFVHLI